MSGVRSGETVNHADFLIERIHQGLNFNRNHRFFLIYGKNTSDEFLTRSMLRANLRETVWASLKENGFELILFYNAKEKFFFLDELSYGNSRRIGPAEPHAGAPSPRASSKMQAGPLGSRNVLSAGPVIEPARPLSSTGRSSSMSDSAVLTSMDDLVQNPRFRTALIIEDTENLNDFDHEIKDQLKRRLMSWNEMKTNNRNAVIFVISREPYDSESVNMMLRVMAEFPELSNLIKVATGNLITSSQGQILRVPAPYETEVDRLINEFRLKTGASVNWAEKDSLVKWLAAEQRSLKELDGLLNESGKDVLISIDTARRRRWISGDSDPRPALVRLRGLIGMEEVKQQIEQKGFALQALRNNLARNPHLSAEPLNLHLVLTGNPGTGKTTVARLIGEIYRDLGLLRRGHTIEATRKDLVAEFVGQSAPRTNALIDRALDGILFIDEAYALKQEGNDPFGEEAIGALLTRMENDRDRLAVIVAGYQNEMNRFINSNPGLTRRFSRSNFIHIEDYTPEHLLRIFELMVAKRGYVMGSDIRETAENMLRGLYESRLSERFRDPATGRSNYGNAGEVRNLVEQIADRQAYRLRGGHSAELSIEDIPEDYLSYATLGQRREQSLEDLLTELDGMVGLLSVKELVKSLVIDYEFSLILNDEQSLPATRHMLFTGNPGTGKTTVARLIGRMLKELGILKSGHFVETMRGDLVAEYMGQTAQKTRNVINKALDGILFIDEAYSLVQGERDEYGREVLGELVPALENHRDRLVVIFAGYTKEMQIFANANSGIQSRIGHSIEFPDYTGDELLDIFLRLAASCRFTVPQEVREELLGQFRLMYERRDRNFGNAREVRVKFFDKMMKRFKERLSQAYRSGQDPKTFPNSFLLTDLPGFGGKQRLPSAQSGAAPPRRFRASDLSEFQQHKSALLAGQNVAEIIKESVGFIRTESGSGTGFVVSPAGHLLTAYHVVEGCSLIRFRLSNSSEFVEAELLAADSQADVAVMKVKARNLSYLKLLEQGRRVELGSRLGLLGYPLGESLGSEITYTAGALSSIRKMPDGTRTFQIDLSAYQGNSGAPVFLSETGEVVGILSFGPNDTLNFAISVEEFYEKFK